MENIKQQEERKSSFGAGLKNFLFQNTSTRQTVVKNTFWLFVSNFGGRIIKAGIIIYGARVLGAEGWGIFSYAVTLAGFLTLFIDPGINAILIRDVAKSSKEGQERTLSTTFVMKIFIIVGGVLLVLFVAPFFSTLPGAKALLPLVALIITFDTVRDFFSSFIRAKEKMELEAGIFLLMNTAIVAFGFIFLALRPSVASFAWAYVTGTAVGAIAATYVMRGYLKKIFSFFSIHLVKPILSSAWPFAITGALGGLLTNADILIISWLRTASDVGIYSASVRIIQMLYVIPVIIQASMLPLFARLARNDNEKFRAGFERTLGLVFLIAIPMAFGGAILGTEIMSLVFGPEYTPGDLAFKILILTMLVDYPTAVISMAIFAYNRQKGLIITSLIGGVSNVALDLALIPHFGITGAAAATLIAQILSNWYLWHIMKKINYFQVLPRLKKMAMAGAIMACAAVILLFINVNVIINIIISSVIYFSALKVLREPILDDARLILNQARGI